MSDNLEGSDELETPELEEPTVEETAHRPIQWFCNLVCFSIYNIRDHTCIIGLCNKNIFFLWGMDKHHMGLNPTSIWKLLWQAGGIY